MLTVIASMDYELSGLRKELKLVAPCAKSESWDHVGQDRRPDLPDLPGLPELHVIGVGKERAQASVRRLLEKRTSESSAGDGQPDGLLLLGVAGAVDPALRTGDLVLSSRYYKGTRSMGAWLPNLDEDAKENPLTPDPVMWELATKACAGEGRKPVYMDSLTVDQVVSAPGQKQSIAVAFPVGIVEMEDYWVAEVAAEFGVSFVAARVVLDTAGQALPQWLLVLSSSRVKAVLSLAARPWRIPTVVRLARQRPVAQRALTEFALKFLAEAANAKGVGETSLKLAGTQAGGAGRHSLRVSA